MKHRACWTGTTVWGRGREAVGTFARRVADAGFTDVFVHLKGGDGLLHWPSERFPQAVASGCGEDDFPRLLIDECRSVGIAAHAWLIDFFEGERGAAFRDHPEWAMRDAKGRTSAEEMLRGERFGCLWMCPARRPGYVDQWLVPALAEFADRYDAASIHHDYVRYPGDVAPDQYCFCDYCLEQMPRFNGFLTDAFSDEPFFHDKYDRPYVEAHWEQSPRVLPATWSRLDRETKSRFLLDGSFFTGGRSDLDYFFYTYRTHWITEFTRLVAEAVRPGMRLSAAVFKNPIHSGRFIGQDWREFAPYVDLCVPMDYRDHYPGSFETHLTLLAESIKSQKVWARDYESLWIGVALDQLFAEERAAGAEVQKDKVTETIRTVAQTGVEGVSLFCVEHLGDFGLWDTVAQAWT